jgi:urease accessory protein
LIPFSPQDAGGHGRDLALLRLLQLFDSQFPVGAFAHSGGIETYAALGGSLAELRDVLLAQIELGWGRGELAGAWLAWHAADPGQPPDALSRLAQLIDAIKVIPSVRDTSLGLGRRTRDLLARLYPDAAVDVTPPHHAVVIGAAGRRLDAAPRDLLLAYGQSLALGTLTAGLRCMPVSPAQAQLLLVEAQPLLVRAVDRVAADPEGSLFTATPALDIRTFQQAQLHTRLFQS